MICDAYVMIKLLIYCCVNAWCNNVIVILTVWNVNIFVSED